MSKTELESPALRAARVLAQDPTLTGGRRALEILGLSFPGSIEVDPRAPGSLPTWPAILKVTDPFIPHKTEVGAVRPTQAGDAADLAAFAREVEERAGLEVRRVLVEERVTIPEGGEALLSLVYDEAFGPVVVYGEGGRLTELRRSVARWQPGTPAARIAGILGSLPLARAWFSGYRSVPPLVDLQELSALLEGFGTMAAEFHRLRPDLVLRDLEINPLALTGARPVALDLLMTVEPRPEEQVTRPDLERLARSMNQARFVAVAGPSTTDSNNLGRVLYDRLLQDFQGEAWAINPKGGEIAGRPVFKSVADLPEAPDVLVLALPARLTAPTLRQAREAFGQRLGTVLMLASGFDETSGGAAGAADLKAAVREMGSTPVLGPNTMALYSQTGSPGDVQVDFLPKGRMQPPSFQPASENNTALVLQSGARFVSFLDRQTSLGFRWSIMVGNAYQTDVADGVALAARDPGVKVVAVYLEGLHPGAGQRLAEAVRQCRQAGKAVVIQKGGRTAKGAATARSHTASMSGSAEIFEALISEAGALVVESEADFLDVVRLASLLGERRPEGPDLFLLNAAGYEGVLASDEAARQGLELPPPPPEVSRELKPYLGDILDSTNNPADVGPATPDEAHGPVLDAALSAPCYHAAVVAVMPHGNGMHGMFPPYEGEGRMGSILVDLANRHTKPLVVSVNGGLQYEGLRRFLEARRIPVLPDAERAVRAYGLWHRLVRPRPC